ncbi:MAG: hypothetical protein ABJQ14_08910, partial [Hyphomicrobiales bacterium]
MIRVLLIMVVGLVASLIPGAVPFRCPTGIIAFNVTSATDLLNLTDLLNCTGQGTFNVVWHSSLTLSRAIEIANMKNVSIIGSGLPTIRGGPNNETNSSVTVDSTSGTGIFSVAGESTLHLSY